MAGLGAVEGGLHDRVREIGAILGEVATQTGRASEQVAEQVDALRAVSSGALREAGELVGAMDTRGRMLTDSTQRQLAALTEATGTLELVETRMRDALGERRDMLESLLSRVNERSEDLEQVTSRFTAMIEDSLKATEAKARQIGGVLANSAQATSNVLGQELERLRTASGEKAPAPRRSCAPPTSASSPR
jgi:phage-related minor tail protein